MLKERARVEPARVLARKDSSTRMNRSHLPCTRPPDVLYCCRPRAHPGLLDRAIARAFVVTRAGTDTMPTRRDENEIEEDAAPATARGACRVPLLV